MQAAPRPRPPQRTSVDLSAYPDLVVVYLGMRFSDWRSFRAVMGLGKGLTTIAKYKPEGLLSHEWVLYGLNHIGMRQYWRDLESLETFTRTGQHKIWWAEFSRNPRGAGFWHETYRRSGGMEAIYLDMPTPIGLGSFAAARAPQGPFMSSRDRLAA